MSRDDTLRLTVPGRLEYRDVAVRTVAAACQLVGGRHIETGNDELDLSESFDAQLVSAFSEIFNNVAMHSYGLRTGEIAITMQVTADSVTVELTDTGAPFDLAVVPAPALDAMPDHGLGIHIAKSFVDELSYQPGPPNVWRLTKYASSPATDAASAAHTPGETKL